MYVEKKKIYIYLCIYYNHLLCDKIVCVEIVNVLYIILHSQLMQQTAYIPLKLTIGSVTEMTNLGWCVFFFF